MDAAQLHEVLPELAERWRRARRAALREVVPGATGAEDDDQLLAQALGVSPGWLAFGVGPQVLPSRRRGRPPEQPAEPEP